MREFTCFICSKATINDNSSAHAITGTFIQQKKPFLISFLFGYRGESWNTDYFQLIFSKNLSAGSETTDLWLEHSESLRDFMKNTEKGIWKPLRAALFMKETLSAEIVCEHRLSVDQTFFFSIITVKTIDTNIALNRQLTGVALRLLYLRQIAITL